MSFCSPPGPGPPAKRGKSFCNLRLEADPSGTPTEIASEDNIGRSGAELACQICAGKITPSSASLAAAAAPKAEVFVGSAVELEGSTSEPRCECRDNVELKWAELTGDNISIALDGV